MEHPIIEKITKHVSTDLITFFFMILLDKIMLLQIGTGLGWLIGIGILIVLAIVVYFANMCVVPFNEIHVVSKNKKITTHDRVITKVDMRVDDPRHYRLAGGIDHLCAIRQPHGSRTSHR